jgi:hypothetical protein
MNIIKKHKLVVAWALNKSIQPIRQSIDIIQFFGVRNLKKAAIKKALKSKNGKIYKKMGFVPVSVCPFYGFGKLL